MPDAAEARIRDSFARQGFLATVGARLERVAPGEVEIALTPGRAVSQQHGFVHGGVVAALADTACGYAAMSLAPAEAEVLTVEFKVNFLAPTKGDRLLVRGRVLKSGRTLSVVEGRALVEDGGETRETAAMTATIMTVTGRKDVAPQAGG